MTTSSPLAQSLLLVQSAASATLVQLQWICLLLAVASHPAGLTAPTTPSVEQVSAADAPTGNNFAAVHLQLFCLSREASAFSVSVLQGLLSRYASTNSLLLLLLLLIGAGAQPTGMATPHVSGAVALYAAAYKRNTGSNPSYADIKAAVMNTGTASSAYAVRTPASLLPNTHAGAAISSCCALISTAADSGFHGQGCSGGNML